MTCSKLATRLLFLLATLMVAGCQSQAATTADDQSPPPTPVDVLVLEARDFTDTFEVLGTAQPIESVQVTSDVPGRILQAYVEEGDPVRRGQNLFRIDVEVDAAGLDLVQTQLSAAERELERLRHLRAQGLATTQQLDTAETEVANLRQSLRQRQISVSRDRVLSPIEGYLSIRHADRGEYASPGAPLAEIIDFDTVVVYAQVPESQIRFVHKGRSLDVHFPALDQSFHGTIHRVALRASDVSRTYRVEIRVDNQEHHILPGMRARLRFERDLYEEVILIPREAVLEGFQNREAIVVTDVDGQPRAQVRTLRLGPGAGTQVLVEEGLNPGDRLILRGHRGLIQGTPVQIIDELRQPSKKEGS